jgi:hypothetical protein
MNEQSVVILNGDEEICKKILQLLAKQGYRATENYEPSNKTKVIVFTK